MIFYFSIALIVLIACIIIAAMVFADDLDGDGEMYVVVTVCSIFLGLIWPISIVVGSAWGLALWIRLLINKASSEE